MRTAAGRLKDAIISICASTFGVGTLVGNAYMSNNVGYPSPLDIVGLLVMIGSLVFAILPGIPLLILGLLGVDIPIRGRERFVELNLWLWIYCAVFYAFLIYALLRYRRRVKQRRNQTDGLA